MGKILKSPKWRALISAILTCLIGVSLAVLGDWDLKQKCFALKIIVFIILSILDVLLLVFCAAQDSKELSLSLELKTENNALKKALSGIILVSQFNSSEINQCIHRFISEGKIDKDIWNYKKACYNLCATIFTFITEFAHDDNVEVSYVKLNESVDGEIELYSYKNSTNQKPKLLNKKRNFLKTETIQYFDMELFTKNSAETKVLYGSATINNHFYRTHEEREKYPEKYNQFIAIPVFCDNQKMIGLLQIACLNKCSLAEDNEVLEEVANKYFVPYANLFLLLHKMNKALLLGIK